VQPFLQWKSNITYSESVFVPSGTQHVMRTRHLSLRPAPLYDSSQHYLITGKIFDGKKRYWTQNVCFDFLYNFCV